MNTRQVATLHQLYNATAGTNWEHMQGSFETLDELIGFMASAARGNPEGLELNGIHTNSGGDGYTIAWTGNGPYGAAHAEFIVTVREWMPQILDSLEQRDAAIARAEAAERVVAQLTEDIERRLAMGVGTISSQHVLRQLGRPWTFEDVSERRLRAATPSETDTLIERFAAALRDKANAAEAKYDWNDGWKNPDAIEGMRESLYRHLAKGDPRDVAIYCAFLWHHSASTARTPAAESEAGS